MGKMVKQILRATLVLVFLGLLLFSLAQPQTDAAVTYIITASADAHSTINPRGSVSVDQGSSRTFTFSASPDYTITRVLINGTSINANSSYTFTNIQANYNISVYTSTNTYYITSTADVYSAISPSGRVAVNYGSSQNFNYSANPDCVVNTVLVDGRPVTVTGYYNFTNVITNRSISVLSSPSPSSTSTPTPPQTPPPTTESTTQPTQNPTPEPQQYNPTPQPTSQLMPIPTANPTPTPTPVYSPAPAQATFSPTVNPNEITQSDIYTGSIVAVATTVIVVALAVLLKRKQPDVPPEDFEFESI